MGKGKTRVRLKRGDPYIFGRVAEEAGPLRKEGVTYEVVPGVTAAWSAAVYAEIPGIHPTCAPAVRRTHTAKQPAVRSTTPPCPIPG